MTKKLKIKLNDLYLYYMAMSNLPEKIDYNKIFLFYLEINKNLFNDYFKAIFALKATMQNFPQYNAFVKEKMLIENTYFKNNELIPETAEEFKLIWDEVVEKYKDYIYEFDTYSAEVGDILSQEIEINYHPIPFRYFPTNLPEILNTILLDLKAESDEDLLERYSV